MKRKPRVFIGSSSEGLGIAKAFQLALEHAADIELWTQGVFDLNFSYLESLIKEVSRVDFAALVLTPDDLLRSRGSSRKSPRDNVIFELGLFMGKLGRRRCFFIYDEQHTDALKLPSDLLGISAATYTFRPDNIDGAVGGAAHRIERCIASIGCRPTLMQIEVQDETEGRNGPNLSGVWEGYSPESAHHEKSNSTLEIEHRGSFIRANGKRPRSSGEVRTFEYEGRFSAGQLVLFFEEPEGRGFIIGSLVLHLSSDMKTLTGKSTYFQHDRHEVITSGRLYKRLDRLSEYPVSTEAKSRRGPHNA